MTVSQVSQSSSQFFWDVTQPSSLTFLRGEGGEATRDIPKKPAVNEAIVTGGMLLPVWRCNTSSSEQCVQNNAQLPK